MWLLQHKKIHKKHLLWLKIVGLCLCFHFLFLFLIFCVYQENKFMHNFTITKTRDYSAPILFLPYYASSEASASAKASTDTTKGTAPAEQQKPTATIAQKIITPKPKTIVKPIKNEPEKATTIETPSKKVEAKKIIDPIKKIVPAKTIKPIMAEKVMSTKTDTPKAIENKAEKVSDAQQKIVPAAIEQKQALPAIAPIPTNAQVSNNFREVEALRRGAQLQKELAHQWHPPIGVSPDCTCDISFFVNQQGKIENLRMVKNSGIVMFDISARQALTAMKMPQWTYGKSLIISFKQ